MSRVKQENFCFKFLKTEDFAKQVRDRIGRCGKSTRSYYAVICIQKNENQTSILKKLANIRHLTNLSPWGFSVLSSAATYICFAGNKTPLLFSRSTALFTKQISAHHQRAQLWLNPSPSQTLGWEMWRGTFWSLVAVRLKQCSYYGKMFTPSGNFPFSCWIFWVIAYRSHALHLFVFSYLMI